MSALEVFQKRVLVRTHVLKNLQGLIKELFLKTEPCLVIETGEYVLRTIYLTPGSPGFSKSTSLHASRE